MKEKKPGGTRPEMGTPEYEEWRKEVLKRRRKRQLKERRKRLAIITAAMIDVYKRQENIRTSMDSSELSEIMICMPWHPEWRMYLNRGSSDSIL